VWFGCAIKVSAARARQRRPTKFFPPTTPLPCCSPLGSPLLWWRTAWSSALPEPVKVQGAVRPLLSTGFLPAPDHRLRDSIWRLQHLSSPPKLSPAMIYRWQSSSMPGGTILGRVLLRCRGRRRRASASHMDSGASGGNNGVPSRRGDHVFPVPARHLVDPSTPWPLWSTNLRAATTQAPNAAHVTVIDGTPDK
jgi:hypothetical protein